jgi:hypothetical protein
MDSVGCSCCDVVRELRGMGLENCNITKACSRLLGRVYRYEDDPFLQHRRVLSVLLLLSCCFFTALDFFDHPRLAALLCTSPSHVQQQHEAVVASSSRHRPHIKLYCCRQLRQCPTPTAFWDPSKRHTDETTTMALQSCWIHSVLMRCGSEQVST